MNLELSHKKTQIIKFYKMVFGMRPLADSAAIYWLLTRRVRLILYKIKQDNAAHSRLLIEGCFIEFIKELEKPRRTPEFSLAMADNEKTEKAPYE